MGDGVALFTRRSSSTEAVATGGPVASGARRLDVTATPGCPGNDPNQPDRSYDVACSYMSTFCESVGDRGSWLVWVWSRPAGSKVRWVKSGFVCRSPQQVQAATPGLSRALVQRAFRQVHFAHPAVHVQPEGNVTLVNLATYYQVVWPVEGFEPGEVASVRLLGRTVRLRPRLISYTYRFGDGAVQGPTSDAGGPYPSGRVRHAYTRTGVVPVSVQALYTGDYQLAGGAWEPIEVTVPVAGDPVIVDVRQARARLEPSPAQR